MILSVGVSAAVPAATLVAGALTLPCAVVGILLVSPLQRLVSLLLIGVGTAAFVIGVSAGAPVSVGDVLSVNQDLIGMLTAMSFLRLVTPTGAPQPSRLRGRAAVLRTAVANHLLGSVINIGAVGIIGDHLRDRGSLRMPDALLLSRSYSMGAYWSPFWAAAAAAASVIPGANTPLLVGIGLVLAFTTILLSSFDIFRLWGDELPTYQGYSLSWELLRIPLALVALVVLAHQAFPTVPVPRMVLLAGLTVTLAGLLVRMPRTALRTVARHARHQLPGLRGEVTLFASAGILAVGLRALLPAFDLELPVDTFTVPLAWAAMVVMIALSVVGVHPIVSIALVGTLVLPLQPDPTLFVLAASIGWGTATPVGPITGLVMFMNSRYGINTTALTRGNLRYLVIVLVLSWPALLLCNLIVSG